jgi:hypothetical protein
MVEKHAVRRVEDKTQAGFDYLSDYDYSPDVGIRVFYDIEGVDVTTWSQQPHLDVHGNLKGERDPTTGELTRVESQGGAFKVFDFFAAVGVLYNCSAGEIAPSRRALENAQGEEFVKLRFVAEESGDDVYFNDYDRVMPPPGRTDAFDSMDKIEEVLREQFLDDYAAGYQEAFRPELIDGGFSEGDEDPTVPGGDGAPEPSSTTPASTSSSAGSEDAFEPDADLPF